MNSANTFAAEVDSAIATARACSDFMLSRAQECAALEPIVSRLVAAPLVDAQEYIRATYRGVGTYDSLALQMFKDAKATA